VQAPVTFSTVLHKALVAAQRPFLLKIKPFEHSVQMFPLKDAQFGSLAF